MSLTSLPGLLVDEPALASVIGAGQASLAVPEKARALTFAALARISSRRPLLVATPTSTAAERLTDDLTAYLGPEEVELFPAWETLPFERVSPGVETMGRRLRVLWRLGDPARRPAVVVASIRALLQRLAPGVEDVEPIVVSAGGEVDQQDLLERLVAAGYRREYQVEHRGEVAVRGSIIDVYGATADAPVRVDLWGDEVDRLTRFSIADQRATDPVEQVELFPCRELLLTDELRARARDLVAREPWGREQWERLAEGSAFDGMESWLPWLVDDDRVLPDLLDDGAQVLVVDPARQRDRATDLLADEDDLARSLARTWGAVDDEEDDEPEPFPRLHVPFDRLMARTASPVWFVTATPEGPELPTVATSAWEPVTDDGARLVKQLSGLLADDYRVVVAAEGAGSATRLHDLLGEHGVRLAVEPDDGPDEAELRRPGGSLVVCPLEAGCILPDVRLAILTESDLTGRRHTHRRPRARQRDARAFFDDLTPGDFVVHHQHGVARYGGMVTRGMGGIERDYLLLEYRGADKLYVPSDQIDAVRHYTGGDNPSLSRLGGSEWQKTKSRVRSEVAEIAQELVVLYQRRLNAGGHTFAADSPWQSELEESFPYEETPDQLEAIEAVKADMEAEHPMDRLVCGDVGFGKTEVALRAAFKAVQDGKQVAVLVPTTLLAQQHLQTFSERLAAFPVRIEMLSRFLTPAQAGKVADGIAEGSVDIVIGTHRLLSDDIRFRDLGLLVVDEEQRFGVHHKEAIKKLRAGVDVLTLTATPIPRTLEMSLTGIRDLTLLNTPPAERQPILTYVGDYDERAVAEAIRRELLREGQVFFVHNRVRDIERVAAEVRELVPEARVAVAHGQMDEGTLERIVLDFWEHEYDVLVCTTIIESGIDMPTVNTLVVDRADLLGLGQLHQLRGRVGRAGVRAYAYLFTPQERSLTEEAYERLRTIGESTELGSGFRIAMRDLEIRGAGNLLGTGQSGHVAAVGYDLYCQMVSEVVAELKGEEPREPAEIKIDLPVDAHLPSDYVAKEELRLEAYRRLAAVEEHGQVDDIGAEWQDRYGPLPDAAAALVEVARLRVECVRTGVREVTVTKGPGFGAAAYTARLRPITLPASKQVRLERRWPKAILKDEVEQLQVPLETDEGVAGQLADLLVDLVPPESG